MMQSIDATQYRGTKIKLTATLRTEDAYCGTIWLRVDGIDRIKSPSLRFDNMTSREKDGPLTATTGWTSRLIVLDVPTEAASIHYGFFLRGHGKVWARNFSLEVVSDAIPVTEISKQPERQRVLPNHPINLKFTAKTHASEQGRIAEVNDRLSILSI